MQLIFSFHYKKYNVGPLWPSIIFFCVLLLPIHLFAQKTKPITIVVKECQTNFPIENALVMFGAQKAYSNKLGTAKFQAIEEQEDIKIQKMGYGPLSIPYKHQDSLSLCLSPAPESISEAEITESKINLYEYLIQLRNENTPFFINEDTTLYYAFDYVSTTLSGDAVIDSAFGCYKLNLKKGRIPLKLLNFEGKQMVEFNYYKNNNVIADKDLEKLRYENMEIMLAVYDLMANGNTSPWERIKAYNEKIELQIDADKNKIFTCWFRDQELTKKIYFDSLRKIQKIEFYKPTLLLRRKYDGATQDFKITVKYRQQVPRIADTLTQYYEVREGGVKYRMLLKLYLVNVKPTKIASTKDGKFLRDIVLGAFGTFYETYKLQKEGLKKGYVKERKESADQ